MATSRLPEEIKTLLSTHVESLGHLEVLLYLYNHATQVWNAQTLSKELRNHPTNTAHHLKRLTDQGFLKCENNWCSYGPKTPELEEATRKLNDSFKDMPVAMIASIYEKPNDTLRGFADAFKLKKD